MEGKFCILALDGGGFRGAYSAYILKRMEEAWNVNWLEQFDMFAGTSTGSILAAGLACGLSASELYELYDTHGKAIFSKRLLGRVDFLGLFTSRYSSKRLKSLLHEKMGDTRLGDLEVPLVIPAVDIGAGRVHVLKSGYDTEFVRDTQVSVVDAVLASWSMLFWPPALHQRTSIRTWLDSTRWRMGASGLTIPLLSRRSRLNDDWGSI